MSINLVNLFLSILPVLILFILLVFFKLNSHLSALFALLPAIFLATFQFKKENRAKNLAEQNNNQDKIDEKLMHSHVFKLLIALSPYYLLLLAS